MSDLSQVKYWLLLWFSAFLIAGIFQSQCAADVTETKRTVQFGFTVKNTTGKVLKKAELWTYGPVKQTSTQFCRDLSASHDFELVMDDLGNQILHFTFKDLPPYGVKIIRVRADLLLNEVPVRISGTTDGFLGPEKFVEADATEIVKLSASLKVGNVKATAKSIYSWVANGLEYTGFVGTEAGALKALQERKGDCTEFADLFTALSRAAGVPARRLGGYVVEKNMILRPVDYHNWAEFYVDGVWKLADSQKKVFEEKQASYIAMQIINDKVKNPMVGFNRFRFEGEGLKVRMNM